MDLNTIKILRERTGAGMADCQKALVEANGDMEMAVDILRKKGIAKAAKRGERETNQGIIKMMISEDHKNGYLLEVNAETDFVARNQQFQDFVNETMELLMSAEPKNLAELLALTMNSHETVGDTLAHLSGVIGEKLAIKRCDILTSDGTVGGYVHANSAIGVLVALDKADLEEIANNVAMQIAASNPCYIAPEDVDPQELDKEKEIYRAQLIAEGKPEEMIEKILLGKANKYFEEVCLIKQEYVKDEKMKVEQILNGAKVEKFIRYSLNS